MLLKRLRLISGGEQGYFENSIVAKPYILCYIDCPSDTELFNYGGLHAMFGVNKTYFVNQMLVITAISLITTVFKFGFVYPVSVSCCSE